MTELKQRGNWFETLQTDLFIFKQLKVSIRELSGMIPQVETHFFSSSLAVNALWHGPDRYISGEKRDTQHNWPVSKT